MLCPQCHHEMCIMSLINDAQIIEPILRHVGMWVDEVCNHGVRIAPSTGSPATETIECGQLVIELYLDDPMLGLSLRDLIADVSAIGSAITTATHAI